MTAAALAITPASLARPWPIGHQPVLEVAQAYADLPTELNAELSRAFAGELNVAQTVSLADRLVAEVSPDVLGLVIARLIAMADESPAHGGWL